MKTTINASTNPVPQAAAQHTFSILDAAGATETVFRRRMPACLAHQG